MKNKLIQKYSLLVCGMCIAFIVGNTQAMEQPINEEEVLSTPYDYAKFTQTLEEANQIIQKSNNEVIHDINRLNKFWTLEIYDYIVWKAPKDQMTAEDQAATRDLWDGIRDCLDRFKNPICVQELLEVATKAAEIRWTDAGEALSQEQVDELITRLIDTSIELFLQQRTPEKWEELMGKNPSYSETLCLDLAARLKYAPVEIDKNHQNAEEAMTLVVTLMESTSKLSRYSIRRKSILARVLSGIDSLEEYWGEYGNHLEKDLTKFAIKELYQKENKKTVQLIYCVFEYNPQFAYFMTLCARNTKSFLNWKFSNMNYISAD